MEEKNLAQEYTSGVCAILDSLDLELEHRDHNGLVKLVGSEILRTDKSHVKKFRLVLMSKENIETGKYMGTDTSL